MGVYAKLLVVQKKLNAPKSKFNKFGSYYYRSAEDILEGCKSILDEVDATLVLSDKIIQIADRIYIEATASFIDTETGEKIENTAYAREPLNVKGMSEPQITGASSTYARKYALNGLFCIDDVQDDDTEQLKEEKDNRQKFQKETQKSQSQSQSKSDEKLNQQMMESVDKDLVPKNQPISDEQIEKIKAEMKRTGITEKTVLSMFKVKDLKELSDVQCVAILNKFSKTKDA